jgi:hypothetical protein
MNTKNSFKIMKIILVLFLSVIAISAEARMYQWIEPEVGTTQLSGKPPAWYRSDKGGPRVFVFDNGRLIDDTAIEVSDDIRRRMRQEAFLLVEKDQQKAKERMAKAEERNRNLKKNSSDDLVEEIDDDSEEDSSLELLTDSFFQKEEEKDESLSGKDMDELRSIISDWESSQTERAKQVLE